MTKHSSRREAFKERWRQVRERAGRAFARLGRQGWRVATGVILMAGLSVIVWSAVGGGGWLSVRGGDGFSGLSLGADDSLRPHQDSRSGAGARVEVVGENRPTVSSQLPWEGAEPQRLRQVNPEPMPDRPRTAPQPAPERALGSNEVTGGAGDAVNGAVHGSASSDAGGDVNGLRGRGSAEESGSARATSVPVLQADVRTMTRPGEGALVRERGWYRHPVYADWRYYPGVEIQMEPGSPVHAALPGVVVFAGEHDRWGLTVRIDHGSGWESTYGQLRAMHVQLGDRVAAGATIGAAGLSAAGEPHVYFGLARNGESVDPGRYLDM